MKLEKQVCSLESAKRLKELGVKQESLFYWHEYDYGNNPNAWPGSQKPANEWRLNFGRCPGRYRDDKWLDGEQFSAFTVAELGEMLKTRPDFPHWIENNNHWLWLSAWIGNPYVIKEKTEAEARSKMIIYLLENNLIKLNGG